MIARGTDPEPGAARLGPRRGILRGLAIGLALGGVALAPAKAQVPGGRCQLVFDNTPTTRLTSSMTATRRYNSYIGGGVLGRCAGQPVTIRSDSAEFYEDTNLLYLIGTVRYREPRATLDSRRLTYYLSEERLFAEGDVVVTLPSGTMLKGPVVDYFRAVPGVRTQSRMLAPQRSRTRLVQKDSAPTPGRPPAADTVFVVADRTVSLNDSLVYLGGAVQVDRPDLVATSDSAFLDGGTEVGQLVRRAKVRGTGTRAFTLDAQRIDLFSRDRVLRRVFAMGEAHAVSDDLDLTADSIHLDLDSARVQRSRAWGKSRAVAVTPERKMVADSLDVRMPRQQVREVRALGRAFAEMRPDTARLRSPERDWLKGDTILATFDSIPRADTAAQPRLTSLFAAGRASSLYQVPNRQRPDAAPAVNYVRGRTITLRMDSTAVRTVTVVDAATGLYIEPDSTAVRRDTTRARRDATRTSRPSGGRS